MKVLNQMGWDGLRIACPHCRSLLLVEAGDVRYTRIDGGYFYATSGCCQKVFSIRDDLIPEDIEAVVRRAV